MTTNLLTPKSTFSELFEVILNGNKEDSRRSARKVRKYLYSSHDSGEYKIIKSIIETAPLEYLDIVEDWRQENFVMAVSVLYFLHDKENKPDFLFPWLFRLLQHKNGNIRQSAVRMITTELGPLTVHIRCPEYKQIQSKSEQSDVVLTNVFISLNKLLEKFWNPTYKRYKYISLLPACPYKSIQMVLSEMDDDCGKVYMKQLKSRLSKQFAD